MSHMTEPRCFAKPSDHWLVSGCLRQAEKTVSSGRSNCFVANLATKQAHGIESVREGPGAGLPMWQLTFWAQVGPDASGPGSIYSVNYSDISMNFESFCDANSSSRSGNLAAA